MMTDYELDALRDAVAQMEQGAGIGGTVVVAFTPRAYDRALILLRRTEASERTQRAEDQAAASPR